MLKPIKYAAFAIAAAACLISTVSVANANTYKEGVHYTTFELPKTEQPTYTEYFSVFCPACEQLEANHHVIHSRLPKNLKKRRVHVDFLRGTDGAGLEAIARAAAISERNEDKLGNNLIWDLFRTHHEFGERLTESRVTQILGLHAEMTGLDLLGLYESFPIKAMARRMSTEQRQLQAIRALEGVPTIMINGRHRINLANLDRRDTLGEVIRLVQHLNKLDEF